MSPISTFARCSVLLFGAALFAADSAVAIQEDNIQLIDSGEVDPNSSTYLYAPKVMFDTLTGEFKFWGCGGVAGDFIIYKASTVFENLDSVVWHDSLHPS